MPECYSCKSSLKGSWDLGVCLNKSERHLYPSKATYFLGNGRVLRAYCCGCYNKVVQEEPELTPKQRLGKVANEVSELRDQKLELATEVASLERKKQQIIEEITELQLQKDKKDNLTCEIRAFQQQRDELVHEISALETEKTQLTQDTANLHELAKENDTLLQERNRLIPQQEELKKHITRLTKEANSLGIRVSSLKQQVEEIMGDTVVNDLLSIIEGLSEHETQQLQLDRASVSRHLKQCIKTAVDGFVNISRGQLLASIVQNTATLTKLITDNEKTTDSMLAMMQSAQVPENVKANILLEMQGHIFALKEQKEKWTGYADKISALSCT